jgi:hypothetical protein
MDSGETIPNICYLRSVFSNPVAILQGNGRKRGAASSSPKRRTFGLRHKGICTEIGTVLAAVATGLYRPRNKPQRLFRTSEKMRAIVGCILPLFLLPFPLPSCTDRRWNRSNRYRQSSRGPLDPWLPYISHDSEVVHTNLDDNNLSLPRRHMYYCCS